MVNNERIKKYLDAGTVLGQVTRARAEEIVRELVSAGDIQRDQAQEWVDNLVERGHKTSEQILDLVRHEVAEQLRKIDGSSLEKLANQVADLLKRSADAGRTRERRHGGPGRQGRQGGPRRSGEHGDGGQEGGDQDHERDHDGGQEGGDQDGEDSQGCDDDRNQDSQEGCDQHGQGGQGGEEVPGDEESAGCPQDRRQEGSRCQQDRRQESPRRQEGKQLSSGSRRRLDTELVRRRLVANRHEAQKAIAAGSVLVAGTQADKAARLVAPDEPIVVQGKPSPFVSRGGQKLAAALTRFGVSPEGRRALDAGASTGGFTDCLLQHGAAQVYAVDVGHGQLDQRLRNDSRVTVLERVNIRTLTPDILLERDPAFEPVSLLTADVSFISLVTVAPALCGPLGRPDAELVLLVKPQFEAGRVIVARGKGVVRDPAVWRTALERVTSALDDAGTGIMGAMVSPLTGPAGNVEFLLHARKAAHGPDVLRGDAVGRLLSDVVDEAASGPQDPS